MTPADDRGSKEVPLRTRISIAVAIASVALLSLASVVAAGVEWTR